MTITAERPVTFPDMTEAPMDRAAVGRLVGDGVAADTITIYLRESGPGRRYESNPFPTPSGYIGRSPYWDADRADEIRAWDARRPGTGSGATGRPRKQL